MTKKTWLGITLLATVAAGPALAQLESPLLSQVQLNIVNPGGKSLAMGGAFVSVADDATAAIANPAGLAQLTAWQLGASGKYFKFEPKLNTANFVQQTDGTYAVTSQDLYPLDDSTTDLEFASLIVPLVQDVSMAVYRSVNLRYKLDASDQIGNNYRSFFAQKSVSEGVSLDEQGGLDLRNQQYGLSVGGKFGPVAIGGGITFNKLRFDLTGGAIGGPHQFIANDVNGDRQVTDFRFTTDVTSEVTSGTRVGFVVGVRALLDEAHGLALGAVYRKNPKFDMSYHVHAVRTFDNAQLADFSCGVDDPNIPNSGASACGSFHVPDDYAIGISGRPFAALLVAFEVQRIKYSQLNDGFVPLFVYRYGSQNSQRAIASGTADDGTLPRVGLEYTIPAGTGTEINIRAGYFHEPAHGTKLALFADADANRRADNGTPVEAPPFSEAYRTTFNGGESESHYSGGIGATISRRFSVDLAFDYSKTTKSGVVSAFYRF